jgi:SEC-C motif domain protein
MRSRYTAHAIGDEAYLHRTFARTARRPFVPRPETKQPMAWVRLLIHRDMPGSTPDIAFVEFSAFHRDASGEHEMREKSEFHRVDGQWLYVGAARP